jgi:hypothetical protein
VLPTLSVPAQSIAVAIEMLDQLLPNP